MVNEADSLTLAHNGANLDPLMELWRESIVSNGFSDPVESVVHELATYFQIAPTEARYRCLHWEEDSVAEWEARDRSSREGLLDFYQTTQSWSFDTLWYHAQQYTGNQPPESVMIARRLAQLQPGTHLDFGAGPGSTSLFFQRLGWKVELADISSTLQEFARWRFAQRGLEAAFYNLTHESLPTNHYDLITACDVMVHVPDPRETFTQLYQALKPGGVLVFNVDARPQRTRETQWHLYTHAFPVLRPVRAVGFQRLPRLEFFHLYRKLPSNPPLRQRAVATIDLIRYNRGVSAIGDLYRAMRAH